MRSTTRTAFAAGILVLAVLAPLPSAAQSGAAVSFLFDLGDGTYVWSRLEISEPSAPNATWNATLEAAIRAGLDLEWAWFSCCGVAVLDIGDRNPPAGFVGVYVWNASAQEWEFASVGLSALTLWDGVSIALYNAAFDGTTFEGRYPAPTPADPYPSLMFRSDLTNSGRSIAVSPATGRVLWDRDLGVREIGSSPAVAYGRVYVTTIEGLFALDADTGEVLWSNSLIRGFSSPAVFDRTLVVGASDGRVYRVDAAMGTERWNTTLLGPTGFSGITSSPKVAWDHVYLGTFNESGGTGEVVALWVSNGTVAWRTPYASVHFSSPAVADGVVYVGIMGRYNTTTQITFDPPYGVLALDARDGRALRFFATEGSVAASPALVGDLLIAASKDGNVYGIERATFAERWRAAGQAGISSPAVAGETVFIGGGAFGASGGTVSALDATTGAVRWTFVANGPVQASLAHAGGRLYFATNTARGTVYSVDASTGDPVWSHVPQPEEFILGSPVVADGVLYAPSDNGHIVAFRDWADSGPRVSFLGTPLGIGTVVAAGIGLVTAVAFLLRRRRSDHGP